MIGTPIAFGLTMIVCFTLFYYYWRIRQLRARLLSVQAAPAHDDFPVEFGIGKNVVETFPTIKACELKCTASEDLQCPICLVEYEEWEELRQLPFCGHVFHTLCVGAWFEKQTTCPVCRMSMSELTESTSFGGMEDMLYRGPRSSDAAVVEVVNHEAPSWIRINRRLPLPAPPSIVSEPGTTTTDHATPYTTCSCSSGNHETKTPPRSSEQEALPRRTTADFHVVNIHQTNSKCKCSSKPVKSDDNYSTDVQILIFQASRLEGSDPIRLDIERFVSEGRLMSSNKVLTTQQSTSDSRELTAAAAPPVVALLQPGHAVSSSTSTGAAQAPRTEQVLLESPQGSFEFQPILTETGELLTFRATTL